MTKRIEWFAIDYHGRFWIEHPGKYRFSLSSDDGSKLYIDDRVVINSDGLHAPQTDVGSISLSGGIHRIRVSYFQGPRFQVALVLLVAGPGEPWRVFNTNEFKPPANPERWAYGDASELGPAPAERKKVVETLREVNDAPAIAALAARPLPHGFEFRTSLLRFAELPLNAQYVLVIELCAAALTASLDPATQSRKLHLQLLALVKNSSGAVVDRFGLDAPYQIAGARFGTARASLLTYTQPLSLAPGRYTVETALLDREGARASASVSEFEVCTPHDGGPGLSSLVLVQSVQSSAGQAPSSDPLVFEGKRVVPRLDKALPPGAKSLVYFVVYPDLTNTGQPRIEVEFLAGGRSLAKQAADLPPAGESGAIPMIIEAAARPGTCTLRITARQGSLSTTQSIDYEVAAR